MQAFVEPIKNTTAISGALEALKTDGKAALIGPSLAEKAHICYAISVLTGRRVIYVAANELAAKRAYEDIRFFDSEACLFLSKEILMHSVDGFTRDNVRSRVAALDRISRGAYRFVVTSPEALFHRLPAPEVFKEARIFLSQGDDMTVDSLMTALVSAGYVREAQVSGQGQFAIRGGIVDIFPVGADNPIRIEYWGDEIDTIRFFDRFTQRSIDSLDNITILPATDIILLPEARRGLKEQALAELEIYAASHKDSHYKDRIQKVHEAIDSDFERFETSGWTSPVDRYMRLIPEMDADLFDYLQGDALVVLDERPRVYDRFTNYAMEYGELVRVLREKGSILPAAEANLFSRDRLLSRMESRNTLVINSVISESGIKGFSLPVRQLTSYSGRETQLVSDVADWCNRGYSVVVTVSSGTRAKGIESMLSAAGDFQVSIRREYNFVAKPGEVTILVGQLSSGYEYPAARMVVITDKELTGKAVRTGAKAKSKDAKSITDFAELTIGDYVVHNIHGIGQYQGLEKLTIDKTTREYIKVKYSGTDVLYLPSDRLDLIQKYIGTGGAGPKVNKLGGQEWQKTKAKVKESLKELAAELILLFQKRRTTKGHAFSPDTSWQREFEERFEFTETDDQLRCIEEIKADMESERIMDRLLCGDVGYGKTEVATRAMFKAVMDGKQVAYLVPTTVLCQQQTEALERRMQDYPVRIESLSRFKTKKQQADILDRLARGQIDILVGTHRILSKDVKFSDFGLFVIDEEQRFGVADKERIKTLKPNVDTLVMTATPIPRTLHMSMSGIRDISIIEEPPEERYPVQTFVMEQDEDVVREAICRELARNGQVFYLYNRVSDIERKAEELRQLVPEAVVDYAHGQMEERELEAKMHSFYRNEFNVLVSTTIIESGLDYPNANTIIVEDADRLGLAQLYQIRGRVGRSNRLAYAYILHRRDKVMNETAEARIKAIKEFTEFGAGYKIALRDLEIRGAGNVLGPEQHGHMASVGYDMYCKLLNQAVAELTGEPVREEIPEATIEVLIDAYIDPEYVPNDSAKLDIYKRIASLSGEDDAMDMRDELIDRFGDIPKETENLIQVALVKAMATQCGFNVVHIEKGLAEMKYDLGGKVKPQALLQLVGSYGDKLTFNASEHPSIRLKVSMDNSSAVRSVKELLEKLIATMEESASK